MICGDIARWKIGCWILMLSASLATRAVAIESWADATLPVQDGLTLWLAADRQIAAWAENKEPPPDAQDGLPALAAGDAMDIVYDGSGHRRHLQQPVASACPNFVVVDEQAVIRFDGVDDFLTHVGTPQTVEAFTCFIVAAPASQPQGTQVVWAANRSGGRDAPPGLALELAAETSNRMRLRVDGASLSESSDQRAVPVHRGEFSVCEIVSRRGGRDVQLGIDGRNATRHPRTDVPISIDRFTLAARFESSDASAAEATQFLHGDVAEVLLFDRALGVEERTAVRTYLNNKHASLTQTIAAGRDGHLLKVLPETPPVQVFVPGFAVRRLPVALTNINNLRYRHDGKLVALAYNGNIFLLTDSDGDGLEDTADLFWEARGRLRGPIGMAVTPAGYPHGSGVFVSSKGKVSLIVDLDGDDQADEEKIIATGWQELPLNVDALGVTLASDGSVYFALGCADFANGHQVDAEGNSQFDLASERGTIVRLSPDFTQRESICTGMRFPITLAFNRHGDLFCTEQEGATWLANGNPLDELLHVRPGRHYGFPPWHPRHLPDVVDEPSVYDYGPQHQSTCGLFFNEPVHGGPRFGPAWWAGDAIVCGESRGKLYRTKLVKTPAGYVARNSIFAALNMLTIDACGTPRGDLVVCCHSGPPDWGTGPEGAGALFQLQYRDDAAPQPVMAFPAGPREVRIAFDRELDPAQLKQLRDQVRIEYGPFVGAGDRFEVLEPSYAVVKRQRATPRFNLPVVSAQLSRDRTTLLLGTTAVPAATNFAIRLPGIGRTPPNPDGREVPQHDAVDLAYDLSGVSADWQSNDGSASWSGWLPHLDLTVARELTRASRGHDALWKVDGPGELRLAAKLDLWKALQPVVQPGAVLDYTPPAEEVSVRFKTTGRIAVTSPDPAARIEVSEDKASATLTTSSLPRRLVPIEILLRDVTLRPEGEWPHGTLDASYATTRDPSPRALPLRRILVPWSRLERRKEAPERAAIPEIEGGDWERGKTVFHSAAAACAKCHLLRGEGGRIGPDLSNLIHRDYDSVLRDVVQPSLALNPDYITYIAVLKDGRTVTGVPVAETPRRVTLGTIDGTEINIERDEIEQLQPSAVSTMPQDLEKKLSSEELRDLMTYLLRER